jgi:hypothetical protein
MVENNEKKLFINKIGYEHHQEWKNCQDFGFINERIKCVVDGCSEGKNSEVGAKLFCHLFECSGDIQQTFDTLLSLYPTFEDIRDHLLFTILYVTEDEENFYVHAAGDGYILKQDHENNLSYERLDFDNSPPYYSYNYVPSNYLKKYQDGVTFDVKTYSKKEYMHIGVATDGLEYILRSEHKKAFEKHLLDRKEFAIKRLMNRFHSVCKDDVTIAL